MEFQVELKEKRENNKEYKDRMRTRFTLAIGQINSSVKQDLLTRNSWKNIEKNNLLIEMLALLTTIYNGSDNGKLKPISLRGMM